MRAGFFLGSKVDCTLCPALWKVGKSMKIVDLGGLNLLEILETTDSMSASYSLAHHLFMTSPDLGYFYVLDNADPANPSVAAALPLASDGCILTLRYELNEDNEPVLDVANYDSVNDPTLERVTLGVVAIEQENYAAGNAVHVMRAWFHGAAVKNSQRILTVAGIGISDIISVDPLKVGLIDAPLVSISNTQGMTRNVIAVQVQASQPLSSGFLQTMNRLWTVSVLIEPDAMHVRN